MTAVLSLWLLWGCGGGSQTVTFSEICDNEIDDDADGAVDCEDSDCAGQGSCEASGGTGTTTTPTGGGALGTVVVTNPSSPIAMLLDASYDFEYQPGLTDCPVVLGRVIIDNQTAEAAQILAAADTGQPDAFLFEYVGQLGDAPWVDYPVAAYGQATLVVKYACNQNSSFSAGFFVDVTNDLASNRGEVTVFGTYVQ